MNRIVFILMSMVLFTGIVTGCNDKKQNTDNIDKTKDISQQIMFDNSNNILQEKQQMILPEGVEERDIELIILNDKKLPGTLTLPSKGDNFPCVVLVHGSGPQDRDETIYENKPFRDIAWELAKNGIATYRYDKRTKVFHNELEYDYKITLDDETVDDAVTAVNMLATMSPINKDKIYVLGHSLGGYSIPRIAEKLTNCAGYIIMAGNVRGIDEIIKEQYEYIARIDGMVSDDEKFEIDVLKLELEKIKNINKLDSRTPVLGAYKAYWKDLKKYNPIQKARKMTKPVLVLQGKRDYQVTITEYNLWKGAFLNNNKWTFVLYPDLNHLMIKGKGKSDSNEYLVKGNVNENVINDIVKWVDYN